jgi:antitoxin component YwqK of YwqJK toxin-antitoxin module
MKQIILLLLLIPTIVLSQENLNQTDTNGWKQGKWEKQYPNGKTMYEGNFKNNKPVGEWKRYHETGVVKAILQYNENNDSVRARLFESAAHPVAEGKYFRENKEGLWIYYADGVRIAEENFVKGLKNGICRKYYITGELLEESEWKNNQKDGKYQAFFPSGKPYMQCMYKNDRREGRFYSYFPSGMTEVESYYTNDLPDGTWKYLNENDSIRFILQYDKGVLKNPEVLINLNTKELENLEKQRAGLTDPEKYLQNPEEYPIKKR